MTAHTKRDAWGLVALTLAAFVATALFADPTQGWRRPADFPVYSSPSGGEYRVCRDGIRFQAGTFPSSGDLAERPTAPTESVGFEVYSPLPPIDPNTGNLRRDLGVVVAQGKVTLTLRTVPYEADGTFWWYFGTHQQRWAGGKLLEPAPDAIFFDRQPGGTETDDIEDCFLFPPANKGQCKKGGWRRWGFKNQGRCIAFVERQAREACIAEREAGVAEFRAKYGTGKKHRHALRNCIRETI
jgi:hypothetical protein